ncbi:hypothetical protein AVEN_115824-1 [Araneus ventricosus]|uniref:Uncharacterized protein n=1 Tax=Araneus ventricosus TaxID=182803 RepID=A0A4Y1ZSX9_ARAVE|nr:hypothetical protein AVEN_115824-1 [Araneus ventricosus]
MVAETVSGCGLQRVAGLCGLDTAPEEMAHEETAMYPYRVAGRGLDTAEGNGLARKRRCTARGRSWFDTGLPEGNALPRGNGDAPHVVCRGLVVLRKMAAARETAMHPHVGRVVVWRR